MDAVEIPESWGDFANRGMRGRRRSIHSRTAGCRLTPTVAKLRGGPRTVPVARVTNLVQLIEQLKQRNIWVLERQTMVVPTTPMGLDRSQRAIPGGWEADCTRLVRERVMHWFVFPCLANRVAECLSGAGISFLKLCARETRARRRTENS